MTAIETCLRADAHARLERNLASLVKACAERVRRFEVDGASLRLVDEYRAPLTDAECEDAQRRIAFGLVAVEMARIMRRPAPRQARA